MDWPWSFCLERHKWCMWGGLQWSGYHGLDVVGSPKVYLLEVWPSMCCFGGRDEPFKRWSLVGYFDDWKALWGSSIIRFLCNVATACYGICFCCYNTVVMKSSLAHPGTMPLGFWKQKLHTLLVLKRLRLPQISSWRTEWCKKKVLKSGAVSCLYPPTISPTNGRVWKRWLERMCGVLWVILTGKR